MVTYVVYCTRTVNYLVLTKWKEHNLKKRPLFLIYTKVLTCVSSSPGKPWALLDTQILTWVKTLSRSQESKMVTCHHGPWPNQVFCRYIINWWCPRKGRICKPEPFLMSSEMGFGEGVEAWSAPKICTIFLYATASVEVSCCQNSERVGGRKKEMRL